ncbi:DNA-processing protein DprA [Paenibacillus doosanensis]|uniref:DNA-processing protein DprA n=1 Tax=Paenibacillus doosanensis TaxID=1229154 RepID=UPI00217FA601|nr:DNA-processing protein DprA [Paenibacillus doosanensis]MCS7461908.1 DNA-processing protein DprA [Paenibacillus doosanensis]
MNNRTILIALHHMEGIGWKTMERIVSRFPDLTEPLALEAADWQGLGLSASRAEKLAAAMRRWDERAAESLLDAYRSREIGIMTIFDERYPELLKQTAQPPWVLYYRGSVSLLERLGIGVVGTRTPTVYGRKAAEQLSQSLASAGACVISGLARGIDSAAHEGALKEAGSTVAVLGCSIDEVYPPENKLLYERIARDGLLLSEYPLQTKPHPGLFPQRNRIIAGLSQGILVIEAALRSGSLITADQALEESRDVYAVPGPIYSPKSQGTLALIKQGAKLVTCAEDILEEYPHWICLDTMAHIKVNSPVQPPLSSDEQTVVDLLQNQPLSIDELLVQSQFTFGHLHSVLLNLLMTKRVKQLPGSVYAIC